jgi:hypothetical protein
MKIGITKKRTDPSMLVLQIQALNKALGDGPVPIQFFAELKEVRNSVIHADSQAEWEYPQGKLRKVADQYRNAVGETEVSQSQLDDAKDKMIAQIRWYQERVDSAQP